MKRFHWSIISIFVIIILEICTVKLLDNIYHVSHSPVYPFFVWIIIATTVILFLAFLFRRIVKNNVVKKFICIFLAFIWVIGLGCSIFSMFDFNLNRWFVNWSSNMMWNL